MNNLFILVRAELAEALKEYKFIWLTLFFSTLGVTQPLINKYMDVILNHIGDTAGIVIDPNRQVPNATDVFLSTISGQFNQIGLIILIISFMGLIATDRNSGMQDFILTRPVSLYSYLYSKLIGHWLISMFSISVGVLVSYLYTVYLFGTFSFLKLLGFLVLYSLWILYLISLVILISTFVKNQILIAILTITFAFFWIFTKNFSHALSQIVPAKILTLAEHQLLDLHELNYVSVFICLMLTVLNISWAGAKFNKI